MDLVEKHRFLSAEAKIKMIKKQIIGVYEKRKEDVVFKSEMTKIPLSWMEILFFSKMIPEPIYKEVKENTIKGMFTSGINFQNKIIAGLETEHKCNVVLCNVLPIDSYPNNYCKPYVCETRFTHRTEQESLDINVGFNNRHILKQLILPSRITKAAKVAMKENGTFDYAIFYSADLAFSRVYRFARKRKIKTICVIPDLPEFNNVGKLSFLMRSYQLLAGIVFRHRLKFIDGLVVLTEQTVKYLNWKKPYVVIEGIAEDIEGKVGSDPQSNYLLYTGTTHLCYGIKNAVEAFLSLQLEGWKFIICGTGDGDEYLESVARQNGSIIFCGVKDYSEIVDLQRNATILINPRQNIGEYTKYSFPSKTMEYLVSGNPVIAYKLDGMPDDYTKYFIQPNDNSVKGLADTINRVVLMDPERRKEIGNSGRKFVIEEKGILSQGRKIINFLNSL